MSEREKERDLMMVRQHNAYHAFAYMENMVNEVVFDEMKRKVKSCLYHTAINFCVFIFFGCM